MNFFSDIKKRERDGRIPNEVIRKKLEISFHNY